MDNYGVNRIGIGSNGLGGFYGNIRKNNEGQVDGENQTAQPQARDDKQVNPNEIFDFLKANSVLPNAPKDGMGVELDPETAARAADSIKSFEFLHDIMKQEFGPLALDAINVGMDQFLEIV